MFFILSYFLPFYTPNSPICQNFKKLWKNSWRYYFTHVYQNYDHMMYGSWGMVCNDRGTGTQMDIKKWHIEVAAPPNKTMCEPPTRNVWIFFMAHNRIKLSCLLTVWNKEKSKRVSLTFTCRKKIHTCDS